MYMRFKRLTYCDLEISSLVLSWSGYDRNSYQYLLQMASKSACMKMRRSFALATMESITKAVSKDEQKVRGCGNRGTLTIGWLLVVVVHSYRLFVGFSYVTV